MSTSAFSLDDWFFHIKQIHQHRMELGLDRIRKVAKRLQLISFSCPVITVAGTNGKGSTTKALESIYHQAGYQTALYTSPHLMDFNERIRINNKNIDDENLIHAFEMVEHARLNIILSFFEFTTLAALFLFQAAKPDVIILEVGLGGRLDAVNIVDSDVAIVTSIALDHMDWLGNSREEIAYEKASIAHAGKLLISGEENPQHTLAETVLKKNAVLLQINRDFFYQINKNSFNCWGSDFHYEKLPLSILKIQNTVIAIRAIVALNYLLPISRENIIEGINQIDLPGRFELQRNPFPCVFDVAHNPHASALLAEQYKKLPAVNNTVAIVGMLKDKAMQDTVLPLIPLVQTWCVCDLSAYTDRGADGSDIAAFLKTSGIKNGYTFTSVEEAMLFLEKVHCQRECDRALIFGSFYTVAAAKRYLLKKGDTVWKKK